MHLRTPPNHFAQLRKLIASPPSDYNGDDGEPRGATRTDIVAKPANFNDGLPPIPDPDDATVRMPPERVLGLLRNNEAAPETFDSNVGQTATRILEPDEVELAQKPPATGPRAAKQPFEIVESRRVRRPRLPSEFAAVSALEPARSRQRSSGASLRSRIVRAVGLGLMGLVVFSAAFLGTRALRDPSSRSLASDWVSSWYDGASARLGRWFSMQGSNSGEQPDAVAPRATPASTVVANTSSAARHELTAKATAPVVSGAEPPVVRIEDLKPLSACEGSSCEEAAESDARSARPSQQKSAKGRPPR